MNARIASILKDRISQFTYVDRIAGMVRTAQMERAGQVVKLPVAIDVADDLACDASTLRDMVPDERYACIVYFEDRGFQRITSRTRGTSFRSSIRLVCWVNTAKFGSDPMAGERIMQQFLAEVHQPGPVNTDTLVGLRTTAETSPERGGGLFGAYTYPEISRQYLLWPFDAFAIDIAAEYRLRPGCEEEPVPGDDSCWTPPTTKRRRNPSEFTCEELQDPETGLTAEQLGPECLDCEGGAECPATTVNGTQSDTPTISVRQGGVEVGTLNPDTGVHNVPECPPCPPCADGMVTFGGQELGSVASGGTLALDCDTLLDAAYVTDGGSVTGTYFIDGALNGREVYRLDSSHHLEYTGTAWRLVKPGPDISAAVGSEQFPWLADWSATSIDVQQATIGTYCDQCEPCDPLLDVTLNGGRAFEQIALQCGLNSYDIIVTREDGTPIGEYDPAEARIEVRPGKVQLQDSAANPIGPLVDVEPESTSNTITAPDATVQLRDSAGNPIGSPDSYRSNTSSNKTAPDGSVQRRDSAGAAIGALIPVRSNQTGLVVTCPDGVATARNSLGTSLGSAPVRSNGAADVAVADTVITRPDGTTVNNPAGVAYDVRSLRSGIVYNFGYILASGQTVSYRAGDEGSYRTAGFFNYTRPVYPLAYAELSGGAWDTLVANNIHGNTLRFTNRTGGAAATSGNRVIRDHLTGLEWYIPNTLPVATTWNAAIDAAEASTVESSTDWMIPTDRMLDTITRDDTANPLNIAPFNITADLWSSTTDPADTTVARRLLIATTPGAGTIGRAAKSGNNGSYIFCRKFI